MFMPLISHSADCNPSYLHINGFIHRDVKAANLLMDDDGTVLLGDLGVAANLAEDTYSPVAPTKPHSVSAANAVAERRSWNADGDAKRVLFDHVMPPNVRPKIGKRKSFVGTVSRLLFICRIILTMLCSPAGWPQKSSRDSNTTPPPISGASVLLRLNLPKADRLAREKRPRRF